MLATEFGRTVAIGDGANVDFETNWRLDDAAELVVFRRPLIGGAAYVYNDSEFVVDGVGEDDGFTVTLLGTPLSALYALYIERRTAFVQNLDLHQNDIGKASLETALDRIVMQTQELDARMRDMEAEQALLDAVALGLANGVSSLMMLNSVADLRALTSLVVASTITVKAFTTNGLAGGGTFVVDTLDTTSPDDGGLVFVDAASRRWKRVYDGIIHVAHFGATGLDSSTDRVALTKAVQALFNSTRSFFSLDLDGVNFQLTSPLTFNNSNINIFNTALTTHKTIFNGSFTADPTGTWVSGDHMLKFAGNSTQLLRYFRMQNFRFDANSIAGVVPLRCANHYVFNVDMCWFRNFTTRAIEDLLEGNYSGGHGFTVSQCTIQGAFGNPDALTAIYVENVDSCVFDTNIQWCGIGVDSTAGGLKVQRNHFSMGSGTTTSVALRCSVPKNVWFTDNDCDGCVVKFDNSLPNTLGAPDGSGGYVAYENTLGGSEFEAWRKMSFTDNDFVINGTHLPAGVGIFNFNTALAGQNCAGLTCASNSAVFSSTDPMDSIDMLNFTVTGPGVFDTDFKAQVVNPFTAKVRLGNIPGRTRIWASDAGELLGEPDGSLSFEYSNSGGGLNPTFRIRRLSDTPAANDVAGILQFEDNNLADTNVPYAAMYLKLLDPTTGSEDGLLGFQTVTAGVMTNTLFLGQGLYTPNATGGDLGSNTINSKLYYNDGVQLDKVIRKATDQTVNNTTVFANDAALTFPLAATTTYRFELSFFYSSAAAADFKIQLLALSATSADIVIDSLVPDGTTRVAQISDVNTPVSFLHAANTKGHILVRGVIINNTAGTFVLQFTQATANASATTIKAGATLRYAPL